MVVVVYVEVEVVFHVPNRQWGGPCARCGGGVDQGWSHRARQVESSVVWCQSLVEGECGQEQSESARHRSQGMRDGCGQAQ